VASGSLSVAAQAVVTIDLGTLDDFEALIKMARVLARRQTRMVTRER
jgi:hypothetical protein